MNIISVRAFGDELMKLSMALSDKERDLYKKVVSRQGELDRMAGDKKLDAAGEAAMRTNTERLKAFRAKSRDDSAEIPSWAIDPEGKMPDASTRAGAGSGPSAQHSWRDYKWSNKDKVNWDDPTVADGVMNFARKNPMVAGGLFSTAAGALSGAAGGIGHHLGDAATRPFTSTADQKDLREAELEDKGPMERYVYNNPIKGRALRDGALGGLGFLAAQPGQRLGGALASKIRPEAEPMGRLVGGLLGSMAPYGAYKATDSHLKKREEEAA